MDGTNSGDATSPTGEFPSSEYSAVCLGNSFSPEAPPASASDASADTVVLAFDEGLPSDPVKGEEVVLVAKEVSEDGSGSDDCVASAVTVNSPDGRFEKLGRIVDEGAAISDKLCFACGVPVDDVSPPGLLDLGNGLGEIIMVEVSPKERVASGEGVCPLVE